VSKKCSYGIATTSVIYQTLCREAMVEKKQFIHEFEILNDVAYFFREEGPARDINKIIDTATLPVPAFT